MPMSAIETPHNFCPTCQAFNSDFLCATCAAIDRLRAVLMVELSKSIQFDEAVGVVASSATRESEKRGGQLCDEVTLSGF